MPFNSVQPGETGGIWREPRLTICCRLMLRYSVQVCGNLFTEVEARGAPRSDGLGTAQIGCLLPLRCWLAHVFPRPGPITSVTPPFCPRDAYTVRLSVSGVCPPTRLESVVNLFIIPFPVSSWTRFHLVSSCLLTSICFPDPRRPTNRVVSSVYSWGGIPTVRSPKPSTSIPSRTTKQRNHGYLLKEASGDGRGHRPGGGASVRAGGVVSRTRSPEALLLRLHPLHCLRDHWL